ncbi:MAG TPA: cobalamin-binding protein [Thermoplasmata archaeon]|nr:cobalamin-binding protein [Thermoplasmata archaeon]
MRVVSVLPSATETVFALGHGSDLVGRSSECDYPEAARHLPAVMRPRTWDAHASSAAIDRRVRTARAENESLYVLDIPLLRDLRPDVLLTQDLCGVCSVTGPEVQAACADAGVRPEVVSLTPRNLEEVWSSIETVGRALDDPTAGRTLATNLRSRTRRHRKIANPRVAVMEWLDPPILAGLWVPEMIEAAGATPLGPLSGEPGRRTTWAAVASERPDLVVLSPCSFSVHRTRAEFADTALRYEVARCKGAAFGTYVADEAYFSRPGPRLADGVDLLRHLLDREDWVPPMPVVPLSSAEAPA